MYGTDKEGRNITEVTIKRYDYETKETETLAVVGTKALAHSMTEGNVAAFLSDLANGRGGFALGKKVGQMLRGDHRTLQRQEVALALGLIIGLSDQKHTDPRNETAIATGKKIKALMESGELGLGAFI